MAACQEPRVRSVLWSVVWLSVLIPVSKALGEDTFREELFFKPLQSGHIYSHFQFTTIWNVSLTNGSKSNVNYSHDTQ